MILRKIQYKISIFSDFMSFEKYCWFKVKLKSEPKSK